MSEIPQSQNVSVLFVNAKTTSFYSLMLRTQNIKGISLEDLSQTTEYATLKSLVKKNQNVDILSIGNVRRDGDTSTDNTYIENTQSYFYPIQCDDNEPISTMRDKVDIKQVVYQETNDDGLYEEAGEHLVLFYMQRDPIQSSSSNQKKKIINRRFHGTWARRCGRCISDRLSLQQA